MIMRTVIRHLVLCLVALGSLCASAISAGPAEAGSGSCFNVGYRVLDFSYRSGGQEKTVTVAVWYPTAASPKPYNYGGPVNGKVAPRGEPLGEGGPYPLLVFSHGYGGSGLGAVFFTEHLAARGWIVAAPDHNDRFAAVRIRTGQQRDFDRAGFLRSAMEISTCGPEDRSAHLYRLDEMKLVLDRMVESGPFAKLIDRGRICVGGHSFGGFTALGLCGTIKERHDDRIKAVLLFSTGAGGYLFKDSELAAVKIPSMLFLGERERNQKRGKATMAEIADKVYRQMPPPKYFVEIRGANHFSFNNGFSDDRASRHLSGSEEQFEVIRRYSIAFLEKHVAGKVEAGGVLDRQDQLISRYLRDPGP
jgi:predicted dienelactone hydrolase